MHPGNSPVLFIPIHCDSLNLSWWCDVLGVNHAGTSYTSASVDVKISGLPKVHSSCGNIL